MTKQVVEKNEDIKSDLHIYSINQKTQEDCNNWVQPMRLFFSTGVNIGYLLSCLIVQASNQYGLSMFKICLIMHLCNHIFLIQIC